jgi:hypothetical protein
MKAAIDKNETELEKLKRECLEWMAKQVYLHPYIYVAVDAFKPIEQPQIKSKDELKRLAAQLILENVDEISHNVAEKLKSIEQPYKLNNGEVTTEYTVSKPQPEKTAEEILDDKTEFCFDYDNVIIAMEEYAAQTERESCKKCAMANWPTKGKEIKSSRDNTSQVESLPEEVKWLSNEDYWTVIEKIYLSKSIETDAKTGKTYLYKKDVMDAMDEFHKSQMAQSLPSEEIIKALSGEKIEDIKTFTSTDYPIQSFRLSDDIETAIQNGLYATGRFTTDECEVLAEGLMMYIGDQVQINLREELMKFCVWKDKLPMSDTLYQSNENLIDEYLKQK